MLDAKNCPSCGAPLPEGGMGLCTKCVYSQMLVAPEDEPELKEDFPVRYKILEKIGSGGFGDVYVADQLEPVKRRVALKIIKLGMDTKQVVARFEAERQALAMMDHPHIAKVHDAGVTELGRPFFVMELVQGVSITEYCDRHRLKTRERLRLFTKVCLAIQHAHHKGIIHRDLKPSNILVETQDEDSAMPKVIDFGIAKATQADLTDKTLYTEMHQFVGTPAYMSPEQAEIGGTDVDTRADVYSLGALLYQLLTGAPPLDPKTLSKVDHDEIRRRVREDEPAKPSNKISQLTGDKKAKIAARQQVDERKLAQSLKGDLDWIVMKAMEKERTRRYSTANALAKDIQRYLDGEAVDAGPPGALYQLSKFATRHRAGFLATTITAFALIVGIGASVWQAVRATAAEAEAVASRAQAVELGRELSESLYAADMNLAMHGWNDGNLKQTLDLLSRHEEDPPEQKGFEWQLLQRLIQTDEVINDSSLSEFSSIGLSNDGRRLAGSTADGRVKVWDAQSGRVQLNFAGHEGEVHCTAFSPDGAWLASGGEDQSVRIWDAQTGTQRFRLEGHEAKVRAVEFHPKGDFLASVADDGTLRLWDSKNGKLMQSIECGVRELRALDISRDGRLIAVGGFLQPEAIIVSAESREVVQRISIPSRAGSNSNINALALTSDAASLAVGIWDDEIYLFDVASGDLQQTLEGHSRAVQSLQFAQKDTLLVSGSFDQTIRLWEFPSGRPVGRILGHLAPVTSIAVDSGAGMIFAKDQDGKINQWSLTTPQEGPVGISESLPLQALAASSHDNLIALAGKGIEIWELGKDGLVPKIRLDPPREKKPIGSAAFHPNRPWLVTADSEGRAQVSDTASGKRIHLFSKEAYFTDLAMSPDGAHCVTSSWGAGPGVLIFWDVASGEIEREIEMPNFAWCVAISPNGQYLAAAGGPENDTKVFIWNYQTEELLKTIPIPGYAVWDLVFSPDSKSLVAGGADWIARHIDLATGEIVQSFNGHSGEIRTLTVSPDGRRLVTGADDGLVKLWNLANGRELITLRGHEDRISGVTFNAEGDALITSSIDGVVRVWDGS